MSKKSSRKNIASDTHWEDVAAYSRAVRIGNIVEVAGTAALEGEEVIFPEEAYDQAQYILLKIKQALEDAGASMDDVVRTRIYTIDMEYWEDIARAHKEVFDKIRPVCTLVEVYSLVQKGLVVEIEATAIISET